MSRWNRTFSPEEKEGKPMSTTRIFSLAVVALGVSAVACYAEEFRGRITKIDPSKNEVIVEGRGSTRGLALGFAIGPDTRILFGREPAKLEDLQTGDRVRVYYENRNNRRTALSITDTSLRPKPTPAEGAPAASPPARNSPAGNAPAAPPVGPDIVAGRLARVGLTEKEIVVVSPGAQGAKETESTLLIPADVKISKDQKPLKLEELKEGEQVTVRTQKRDGHLVAAEIQSGGTATAATPTPASPPSQRIEKIRQALKIADWFLQQMEEQKGTPK
jgi:Cu/Ag efflux protein CusF